MNGKDLAKASLYCFGLLMGIMMTIAGLIVAWPHFIAVSAIFVQVLALLFAIGLLVGLPASVLWHVQVHRKRTHLRLQREEDELKAIQDENRRKNEEHEVKMFLAQTRVAADERGNRPALIGIDSSALTLLPSGNFAQHVPHTLHYVFKGEPGTSVQEEKPSMPTLPKASTIHIPTFAESLASGEIGPGQRDMLFCYELIADEQTGQIVEISPVRGEIGALHTQFVAGGSQSGKTTYMAGSIAQAAAMNTLLYIIDPHKKHPEKSIAAKVQAFSDYLIMPPASTHEEIARLLEHATKTRDALIQGKATRYQRCHIMVVVDEVPALMAYQKSQEKSIRQLYVSLALFMQSIGTQTAKFGMTGLYGSQFVTKDELGDVEIRDACMSQMLLRLHPTQAQALRILGKTAVQEMPRLDKGHGFLMLSDSFEPVRVASGNVTQHDLTRLAQMLPPSPLKRAGETTMKRPLSDSETGAFTQFTADTCPPLSVVKRG